MMYRNLDTLTSHNSKKIKAKLNVFNDSIENERTQRALISNEKNAILSENIYIRVPHP